MSHRAKLRVSALLSVMVLAISFPIVALGREKESPELPSFPTTTTTVPPTTTTTLPPTTTTTVPPTTTTTLPTPTTTVPRPTTTTTTVPPTPETTTTTTIVEQAIPEAVAQISCEAGDVSVELSNSGNLAADFTVEVVATSGTQAAEASVAPSESVSKSFDLDPVDEDTDVSVRVVSGDYTYTETLRVDCVDNPVELVRLSSDSEPYCPPEGPIEGDAVFASASDTGPNWWVLLAGFVFGFATSQVVDRVRRKGTDPLSEVERETPGRHEAV